MEWWGCSHQLTEKRGAASHTCFHRKEGASGITEHTERVLQRGTRDQESLERRLLTGLCTRLSISGKGRKAHILPSHFYTIVEEEEVPRDTCPEDAVVLRAVECPLTTRLLYRKTSCPCLFVLVFCLVLSFQDGVSLCSPDCPRTLSVAQAGPELGDPPASAARVLGLKP